MPKLGYRPDAHDARDFDAEEKLGAAVPPPSADLRPLVLGILDQGGLNACVAHAILQAVRMSQARQGAAVPVLGSRMFGYYLSRAYHHEAASDSGTFLRTFFAALNKFGFCPEAAFPYDDGAEAFKKMPPAEAFRQALDQASPTVYRRITTTGAARVNDIKRALAAGFPVCFGTDVSAAFVANQQGSGPIMPPTGEPIAGGHALVTCGYRGDDFDVPNSWGTSWGQEGYCTLGADYLAWDETRDIWLVEAAPLYSGA